MYVRPLENNVEATALNLDEKMIFEYSLHGNRQQLPQLELRVIRCNLTILHDKHTFADALCPTEGRRATVVLRISLYISLY